MRTLIILAAVATLLTVPTVLAAGTTTIAGTLAAWVPAVAVVQFGDAVAFRSADFAPHIAVVCQNDPGCDASTPVEPDGGAYGTTTTYSNLAKGRYDFVCSVHPWMVGVLSVL